MYSHRQTGCGLSEAISYKNLTVKSMTEMIVSVLDGVLNYFHIERAPVVSSSFGGYLVLLYTLQRPQRVSKLIFEGCPALVEGSRLPRFMKIMLAFVLYRIIPELPTTNSFFEIILRKLGHGYSVNNRLIPEAFVDWYVRLFNNTSTQKNDISLARKAIHAGTLKPEFIVHDTTLESLQPTLWKPVQMYF